MTQTYTFWHALAVLILVALFARGAADLLAYIYTQVSRALGVF